LYEYQFKVNLFNRGLIENNYGEKGIITEIQNIFLIKIINKDFWIIMDDIYEFEGYRFLKEIILRNYNSSIFYYDFINKIKISKKLFKFMENCAKVGSPAINYYFPIYSSCISYSRSSILSLISV